MFPNKPQMSNGRMSEEEYKELMSGQPDTEWTDEELEKYYQQDLEKKNKPKTPGDVSGWPGEHQNPF